MLAPLIVEAILDRNRYARRAIMRGRKALDRACSCGGTCIAGGARLFRPTRKTVSAKSVYV